MTSYCYESYKYFARRKAFDKVLLDKVLQITKIPKYEEYQTGRFTIVCKIIWKQSEGSAVLAGTRVGNKIKPVGDSLRNS